jgi:imidazolonepropionase-like amidohydrolase
MTFKNLFLLLFLAVAGSLSVAGQIGLTSTHPTNGSVDRLLTVQVIDGARVQVDAETVIEAGHVAMYRGRIVSVGAGPYVAGASEPVVVHDARGMFVYAGLVDVFSDLGLPAGKRAGWDGKPHYEREDSEAALAWNAAIRPEFDASANFETGGARRDALRKAGFGAVLTHRRDGIVRGSGVWVTLAEGAAQAVIMPDAARWHSFSKGSSQQSYPSSLMGSIALLRQTYCDALWSAQFDRPEERNLSLEAFNKASDRPAFFECSGWQDVLRADRVGDEFGVQYTCFDRGDAYQRLEEVAATKAALVVSLKFPEALDVSDPYLARLVSLKELKHWELAPYNAARISDRGIDMALTMHDLKDADAFWTALRKAVACGLSQQDALAALTTVPAAMGGASDRLGRLAVGMEANVLVASGPLFDKSTVLRSNWVQGVEHPLEAAPAEQVAGRYSLNLGGRDLVLGVKQEDGSAAKATWWPADEPTLSDSSLKVELAISGRDVVLQLHVEGEGVFRLNGNIYKNSRIWEGRGQSPDGQWLDWAALRQPEPRPAAPSSVDSLASASASAPDPDPDSAPDSAPDPAQVGQLTFPLGAYGSAQQPGAETLHIKGATVWTCGPEGVIEDGDVLIHKGRIVAVGRDLDPLVLLGKNEIGIQTMEAEGRHLTPGIIDEHTHIAATRGINESGQACSAEVEIGSVLNSDDVNIYRHLAGGVTAGQVLHGSANPIGGQSGVIKFRWGASPEELKIEGAAPFIKFALGENVKQSNWGDRQTVRFPQTRMGVEQVFYDHFHRAREYGQSWIDYERAVSNTSRRDRRAGRLPLKPRRDLELETLLEILRSERFVTCHSYQQGEINMLMHVADSMGFRLNTFTHILEGYKVADKMREHGAGGSGFSDWWAYKFEVKDAIPYNGALLWENGVVTAFNSDDREMARRLNQEAAKAVKYGGVPEQEALKFVTLNPAILLHLDHRMGSLEPGKDADLVIWNDHPLSVYAQPQQTFVDGRRLFDIDRDLELRDEIRLERARLIQKMIDDPAQSKPPPKERRAPHYHCDTVNDEN